MRYLFNELGRFKKNSRNAFIYLFLDFDGTLAPIADRPESARMRTGTRRLLARLASLPGCKVAIVSGRSIANLKKKVRVAGVVYVGNHGFEIDGPKLKFRCPIPARYRSALDKIKAALSGELSGVGGFFIEDKGYSLAIHYRLAARKDIPRVKSAVYGALVLYEVRKMARVVQGKMVLEIRPPVEWDKGRAVMWLLARQKFALRGGWRRILPVYLGDDTTDEDAFRALKGRGYSILVGSPKRSAAGYYLRDPDEVAALLKAVLREPAPKLKRPSLER